MLMHLVDSITGLFGCLYNTEGVGGVEVKERGFMECAMLPACMHWHFTMHISTLHCRYCVELYRLIIIINIHSNDSSGSSLFGRKKAVKLLLRFLYPLELFQQCHFYLNGLA